MSETTSEAEPVGRRLDVWVVTVHYEDDEPDTYGPYTERQARRVAERLMGEVELATSELGINLHPYDMRSAYAVPLTRYGKFLTADERREARRNVRAENQRGRPEGGRGHYADQLGGE